MLKVHAAAFLLCVALAAVIASSADARPPAPLQLSSNLNGEPVRIAQGDGGGNLLYSTGTTVANATVNCGRTHKVVCPVTAVNLCVWNTDAGCSATVTDLNYGDPIAAGGFGYFVAQDCPGATTKVIAAVSQTDAGVSCPVFEMR